MMSSIYDIIDEITFREKQVLQLMASELTVKEIAAKLFLSPRTIENYRDKLFLKTDCKSRIGLVIWGIKNNYIEI